MLYFCYYRESIVVPLNADLYQISDNVIAIRTTSGNLKFIYIRRQNLVIYDAMLAYSDTGYTPTPSDITITTATEYGRDFLVHLPFTIIRVCV